MENSKNSKKKSKKLKNKKSAIDENLANRRHGSKKRFLPIRWKPGKQAPLALHASSCSAPLGLSCSCFRAFAFVLLLSCFSFASLMYPWITSWSKLGGSTLSCYRCRYASLVSDSLYRISFATVTSCSSCVCLLLLALRSRFARWMSLASVTSRSDCVCPLSLCSL